MFIDGRYPDLCGGFKMDLVLLSSMLLVREEFEIFILRSEWGQGCVPSTIHIVEHDDEVDRILILSMDSGWDRCYRAFKPMKANRRDGNKSLLDTIPYRTNLRECWDNDIEKLMRSMYCSRYEVYLDNRPELYRVPLTIEDIDYYVNEFTDL